jgi:hypothetical protein
MEEIWDADTGQRGAEVHRQNMQSSGLVGECPAKRAGSDRRLVEVSAQDVVVVGGQQLGGRV